MHWLYPFANISYAAFHKNSIQLFQYLRLGVKIHPFLHLSGGIVHQSSRLIIWIVSVTCLLGIGKFLADSYENNRISTNAQNAAVMQNQNDFWMMLQGTKPIDNTPIGGFAKSFLPYVGGKNNQSPEDIPFPDDYAVTINSQFGGKDPESDSSYPLRDKAGVTGRRTSEKFLSELNLARSGNFSPMIKQGYPISEQNWVVTPQAFTYTYLALLVLSAVMSFFQEDRSKRRAGDHVFVFNPKITDIPAWIGVIGLAVSIVVGTPLISGILWATGWFVIQGLISFLVGSNFSYKPKRHQPEQVKLLKAKAKYLKKLPQTSERDEELQRISILIKKAHQIPEVTSEEYSKTETQMVSKQLDDIEAEIDQKIEGQRHQGNVIRMIEDSAS